MSCTITIEDAVSSGYADREIKASMMNTAAERNIGLDLLRGLCACAVATYHFLYWREEYLVISMGSFGVYVFFILSALTMMLVYGEKFSAGLSRRDVRNFFKKRCARVLPLLMAVSAISVWFYGWSPHLVGKAILTGTGLMFLGLPGHHSIATGAWSLGIEIAFYAVFPLVALLVGRSLLTVFVAAVVLVAAQQINLKLVPTEGAFVWVTYTVSLTFAPFFALGMLVYFVNLRASIGALVAGFIVLTVVLFYSMVLPLNVYNGGKAYVMLVMLSALSTLLFYSSRVPTFLIKPADVLGKISYSLYLTHWMSFEVGERILNWIGVDSIAASAIVFACLSLTSSYFIYTMFENPARLWLSGEKIRPLEVHQT